MGESIPVWRAHLDASPPETRGNAKAAFSRFASDVDAECGRMADLLDSLIRRARNLQCRADRESLPFPCPVPGMDWDDLMEAWTAERDGLRRGEMWKEAAE